MTYRPLATGRPSPPQPCETRAERRSVADLRPRSTSHAPLHRSSLRTWTSSGLLVALPAAEATPAPGLHAAGGVHVGTSRLRPNPDSPHSKNLSSLWQSPPAGEPAGTGTGTGNHPKFPPGFGGFRLSVSPRRSPESRARGAPESWRMRRISTPAPRTARSTPRSCWRPGAELTGRSAHLRNEPLRFPGWSRTLRE